MKRRLLTLFLLFSVLPFADIMAQEFLPFYSSPYSGVTGVQLNPASIAGSKYKFDVTVFGGSVGVHNDLLKFSRKKVLFNPNFYQDMWSSRKDFWNADLSQDTRDMLKHYFRTSGGNWGDDDYGGYFAAQMDILHMMYSINDRISVALGYSMRGFSKAHGIPEGVASNAFKDYIGTPNIGGTATGDADISAAVFHQIAASGAYTLMDNTNHKLKVGATAKILFGGKSFFAHADSYNINYVNRTVTNLKGEIGKASKGKLGFGFDIGVEYEWQPDELKGNEIAEYRLKVGASLLDIGGFKSKDAEYRDFKTTIDNATVPNGINSFFNKYTNRNGAGKGDYTMGLPMVFTAQVDYNFGKGFFLNFTPYIAFNQSSAHKMSKFTSFNLIPHFEMKNFGVSVPIQYDQYGKFTAGIGLRAFRHVWIGSNTLFKNLWPGDNSNYSADLHVMVKVPILKASNDRDGDGIPDHLDKCPDAPGLKKFEGCPDSDGDGIPDHLDKCPNDAGPTATEGCPDRDGDGVIDKDDRCPDQPGPASLQGCPDTDGDGIPDIDDACPNEPGPKETKGCPDRDGDGVADKDDRCPDQPGPASLQGCPDRDGDGVPDIDDKCPDVPGPKENYGCPVDEGIKNVEFDIDKFNIRPEFIPELDKVVKMMQDDPEAIVTIVGHTDNTYTRPYNMNLSKRRAESVKNYLVKKKIAAKRIKTQYFGPDKPIETNDTVEGRQKNRRAEITINIK
ncbi:MAG: DUF5723 family protein [Prevotellaceae bacterium]|jgi:outer membrane protein OmpA-like peptidoglycan-associated protein|nr:DUF5723 family protein [Prevotellaceae bacterium]